MAAVAGAVRDELEGKACGIHISRKTSEMLRISCTQLWTGQRARLSGCLERCWSEGQGAIPPLRSVEKHFHERAANADLSTALRSGRDDKGEGGASGESGGRTEAVFITLGEPKAN
jgi:hypothetical protein